MQPRFRSGAAAGLLAAAAFAFLTACSRALAPRGPAPAGTLAFVIDSVLHSPPLERTHWGIAVIDRQTGETVIARNADHHFVPASNQKLVVAIAALALLGPDWRWETPVLIEPGPADSIAASQLIAARGDPTWSERFFPSDLAVLDSIVAAVMRAGVRRIEGDVIIDASRFGDAKVNGTWEVGDLPFGFAPPVDAFAIAEATFRLALEAGASAGADALAVPIGGADWQPVIARLRTDTLNARPSRTFDTTARADAVVLAGTVPLATADTLRLAVTSPADYAGRALRSRLEAGGIPVSGQVRVVRDTRIDGHGSGMHREVGRVRSPPLAEIVAGMLRPSQNWIAEQLLKTLGAELRGEGTWEAGLDVERRYLIDRAGIDSLSFVLRDASGLSVQNLLTPETIVRMLEHARAQPWAEVFRDALPAAGMAASTMEGRLTELADRLRAKTGTVTHVNSLSGYLVGDDGRELTFSIMTNASGRSAASVRRGMDRIVRALADRGDPP